MISTRRQEATAATRPASVRVAAFLLVLHAFLGVTSPFLLMHLLPSSKGWFLIAHSGGWVIALSQALLALLLWRRTNWPRFVVAGWAVFLVLAEYLYIPDIQPRLTPHPMATAFDILGPTLIACSAFLLFLPVSSKWLKPAEAAREA
jgi:hypothetical protein